MAKQLLEFDVEVKRTAIGYRSFHVHAPTIGEAERMAVDEAASADWTGGTTKSEYEVQTVSGGETVKGQDAGWPP